VVTNVYKQAVPIFSMPYKSLESRREHYKKNKDKINAKRREYCKSPETKKRIKEYNNNYRKENRKKLNQNSKVYSLPYREKIRKLVFEHYGKECACCGEKNPFFLTIDHINGDGTKHRKKIKIQFNSWLIKNNFPDGFQTLCMNCNWGRYKNGGICPHKDKKIL